MTATANITATTKSKNYEFIDNIRGLAMMSIVAEHAFALDVDVYNPKDKLRIIVFSAMIQLVKFGTINFFLIAGFLIGDKFRFTSAGDYLKKRIKNTFMPWVFWSLAFMVLLIIRDYWNAIKFAHGRMDDDYGSTIVEYFRTIYLFTSFWFIPNFLCCITILLAFRKHLYSYVFGGILLAFTLFYTVNIYYQWIEPRHSVAILGFVFFLWLGAQFNKHLDTILTWLNRTPVWWWIAASLITFTLGVIEGVYLKSRHSIDQYNSLRLSNMLYSLSFFFMLLRIKEVNLVGKIRPRETTFGIYLIHFILNVLLLPEIFTPIKHNANGLSLPMFTGYQFLRFLIVYLVTYGIVWLINRTRMRWCIGRSAA